MQPTFLHLARAILLAGSRLHHASLEYDIANSTHRRKPFDKARRAAASSAYRAAVFERDHAVEQYRLALFRAGQRPIAADRMDPYFIIHHADLYYSRHR